MDNATAQLMDRLVGELTAKEASELSAKLRKDAAHSYQIGVPGSGFAMNKALGVVHKHEVELAETVWQAMLRTVQDADARVEPELTQELQNRYDGYLREPLIRIRKHVADYVQAIGSEPIPAFSKVEKDTQGHHHNEIALWVRRVVAEAKRMQNANVTFNLTGANPKVNINSQDYSINVQNAPAIFEALRDAIEKGVENPQLRKQLTEKATEMEKAVGDKPKYLARYNEFMTAAEKTISVFGKFIPVLSQYLQ